MKIYRRWLQAALAAFLLVLTVTVWAIFAPVQLGGQAVYVIVNGNSMEPHFHYGDLIIAHQASDYRVGDIVVYRSAELKSLVFHRIIGLNLDHFILKGDNNFWTDSYQPTQAELIGKSWIYIPNAGNTIKWLRMPISMAILAGSLGIIVILILMGRSKHGKAMNKQPKRGWFTSAREWAYHNFVERLKNFSLIKILKAKQPQTTTLATVSSDWKPIPPKDKKLKGMGGVIEWSLFIFGFVALASLALGVFAFTRPVTQDVADNVNYQQLGTFSYITTAPAGIYDTTTLTSGAPLFPKLNCSVILQFNYSLMGNQLQGLAGTHQLTATILDVTSGWQRTLPLETQTVFSGNTFVTLASLDLCRIEATVAVMEDATDLHPSSYSLIINPRVAVTGQVAGRDLQTVFEPQLLFLFDKVHFYIYKADALTDPLNPSQAGLIEGTRKQANTLSVLGLKPEVGKMRALSLIGLVLSLSGLLILGIFISNQTRGSQEALIQLKYGSMLVDVHNRTLEMSQPVIEVITMDDLGILAERNSDVILHEARGLIHYYFVQGDRISYRFTLNNGGGGLPEAQPLQLEENLRQGIERGEFQVYYQPIVSLPDGKITAVEALLRWQHPERGLVPAAEFIFAAEKTGLIDRIGEWMLLVACTQFEEWQRAGIRIKLAVNFSERQLKNDPADIIARVLHETGMEPHTLQIEIPEASVVENVPNFLHNLQKLKELGVQLSVDGFAGQSPLSSLEQFQINSVKLDRHVVGRIGDPENAASVSVMISAVLNLGLNVIAEGVETEEQLEFLREQLCTLAQGYLLGRPAPADEVTLLLEKGRNSDRPKPIKVRGRSKKEAE